MTNQWTPPLPIKPAPGFSRDEQQREDVKYLRRIASGTPVDSQFHVDRLCEIATRIETGFYDDMPPLMKKRDNTVPQPTPTALGLLDAAAKHMRDRAATYDTPEGERSMGKTVEAFNAITGRDLRESEGWLLMAILKMVRSEQRRDPHRDSIDDGVAYSALYGEARLGGK